MPKIIPHLGPVTIGGKPILNQDLTHATGGFPNPNSNSVMPAFDDAFGHPGMKVIAPEPLTVVRASSAARRDGRPNGKAFYATGTSKVKYWFGHIDKVPPIGKKYKRGEVMAKVSPNHEVPHLHVGVNAKALIGHDLIHHTNYTHGAPTVGDQLVKALEV